MSTALMEIKPTEDIMNTTLNIGLAAALLLSSTAFAAQPNGRDSVYATPSASARTSVAAAEVKRSGRDSIYAFGKTVTQPVILGNLTLKPGRA
jgi:hypothetical protein